MQRPIAELRHLYGLGALGPQSRKFSLGTCVFFGKKIAILELVRDISKIISLACRE